MTDTNLQCKYFPTALGCDAPEVWTLVAVEILGVLLPSYFLYFYLRSSKGLRQKCFNYFIMFWSLMIISFTFKSILTIVHIKYVETLYQIVYVGLNQCAFFLSMSLIIAIIIDLLYQYQGITATLNAFFKVFYVLVLLTFLGTGVFVSVHSTVEKDTQVYYIWHASTTILICVFAIVPALKLIQKMTYPVIQPGQICCVKASYVLMFVFVLIQAGRVAYDFLMYTPNEFWNTWYEYYDKNGHLPSMAIWFIIGKTILFETISEIIICILVHSIFLYDLGFQSDNFYAPQKLL